MPVTRRGAASRDGFTLVELLAVMTVSVVLMAIAMPYIDVADHRAEQAATEIRSMLIGAQQYAVLHQHDVAVILNPSARTVSVHLDEDSDGTQDAGEGVRGYVLPEGIVMGRGLTPAAGVGGADVSFAKASGVPTVRFHRNGSASEAGWLYLTTARALTASEFVSDTRLLTVGRATGRVERVRYTGATWTEEF